MYVCICLNMEENIRKGKEKIYTHIFILCMIIIIFICLIKKEEKNTGLYTKDDHRGWWKKLTEREHTLFGMTRRTGVRKIKREIKDMACVCVRVCMWVWIREREIKLEPWKRFSDPQY